MNRVSAEYFTKKTAAATRVLVMRSDVQFAAAVCLLGSPITGV